MRLEDKLNQKLNALTKMAAKNDVWEYKGHKMVINIEKEDDNTKAKHFVFTPDGKEHQANISPYDTSRKTLELWLDAGMPQNTNQNWDQKSIQENITDTKNAIKDDTYDAAFGPDEEPNPPKFASQVEASIYGFLKTTKQLDKYNAIYSLKYAMEKPKRDKQSLIKQLKSEI